MKKSIQRRRLEGPDYFAGFAAVPLYFIAGYAYSVADYEIITDRQFDRLCRHIDLFWDLIEHPHKELIDRESLESTTVFHIEWNKLPDRIISSAKRLIAQRRQEESLLG